MFHGLRVGRYTLLLVTLVAFAACAPRSHEVRFDYKTMADTSDLRLDRAELPTLVYKRPGAPTLAAYKRFIVDPVRVFYSDPEMDELEPEQVAEMQNYFRTALIKELREAGYEIGTRSQAGTMRMSFTISGLSASGAGGAANVATMAGGVIIGLPVIFAVATGEVTVEGVFREALTNRIDAVAVERSKGSRWLNDSPWSTWSDVRGSFDQWAEGIREAIDKAHNR